MNYPVRKPLILLIISLVLLLTGCATRIPVTTLVPAEINLHEHRALQVLAVPRYQFPFGEEPSRTVVDFTGEAPFVVYSGASPFTARNLQGFMEKELTDQLTDTHYVILEEQKPTATISLQITDLDIDEYVYGQQRDDARVYYLRQQIRLSISCTISDVIDQSVIYTTQITKRSEQTYTIDADQGPVLFAPSMQEVLEEITRDAISEIIVHIAPRMVTRNVSLAKGPQDNPLFAEAYQLAKEGNYATSRQRFLLLWEEQYVDDAAYNAALLSEALGDRDKAIELMQQLDSERAKKQLRRMIQYREQSREAERQF